MTQQPVMAQQPVMNQQPAAAPATKPPDAGRLLAVVVAGLGVVVYLMGFFTDFGLATGIIGPLLIGGGLLVGATVLPKAGRMLLPGAVSVTVGMLLLLQSVAAGGATASEVVVLVLALLQSVAAVGAVLLDEGVITAPVPRPKTPSAPSSGGSPQGFGQPTYGQPPIAQAPFEQAPFGQAPSSQPPFGQAPFGQSPSGQAPYGQSQPAPGPSGPHGQPGYGQPSPTPPPDMPSWAQPPGAAQPHDQPSWGQPSVARPAPPGRNHEELTQVQPSGIETASTDQQSRPPWAQASGTVPAPPDSVQPSWVQAGAEPATPWYAPDTDSDTTVTTAVTPRTPPASAWPGSDASFAPDAATFQPDDATPATGESVVPAADVDQESGTTRLAPSDETRRN